MKDISAKQLSFFIQAFQETMEELGYTETQMGSIRSMFLKHLRTVLAKELLLLEENV